MTSDTPSTFHLYRQIRADLARRFPNAIAPVNCGKRKRCLAIGIHRDLAARAPDIGERDRRLFFKWYTRGHNYRAALQAGQPRVDLDGNEIVVPVALRMVGADRVSP